MTGGPWPGKAVMRSGWILTLMLTLVIVTGCGSTTPPANSTAASARPSAVPPASAAPDAAAVPQATAQAATAIVPTATPAPPVSVTAAVTPTVQVAVDGTNTGDVAWARTQITTTLYAAPDTTADVLDTVPPGSLVVVTQAQGDWYRIIHLGDSPYAWVPAIALTFDLAQPEENTPAVSQAAGAGVTVAVSTGPSSATSRPASNSLSGPATANSGLRGTLVFQTANGGTIYVYDLASQSLRSLTGGFDPALSPDGKTVAFTRVGGAQGVYLIDIDGQNERLIYSGSESLRAPHWSPDGRYIVFSRVTGHRYCRQMGPQCVPDRPGLENLPLVTLDLFGLSRIDRAGNNFRDIVALETAVTPDWNEAGIVYEGAPGIQVTADQPDVTNRQVVGSWDYHYQDPDWQPGGGRIVFQAKEGSHWEIFSVNADGTGLTALTKPGSALADVFPHNVSPAWSPDGQSIVFLSNRDATGSAGTWHLWVMNADGSNQRLLDPGVLGQLTFRYDFALDQVVDWR